MSFIERDFVNGAHATMQVVEFIRFDLKAQNVHIPRILNHLMFMRTCKLKFDGIL